MCLGCVGDGRTASVSVCGVCVCVCVWACGHSLANFESP